MADSTAPGGPSDEPPEPSPRDAADRRSAPPRGAEAREGRLAAALRANLRRRKTPPAGMSA